MRWIAGAALIVALVACSHQPLADRLATADHQAGYTTPPASAYERTFAGLLAHCTDSAAKVEEHIDTDAGFLSSKGYPISNWAFMRKLVRVMGVESGDCSAMALEMVNASGATL